MNDVTLLRIYLQKNQRQFSILLRRKNGWTGGDDRLSFDIEVEADRLRAVNWRSFSRLELNEFIDGLQLIRATSEIDAHRLADMKTATLLAERISQKPDGDLRTMTKEELNSWNDFRSDFDLRIAGNESVAKVHLNFQHGNRDMWRLNFSFVCTTPNLILEVKRKENE